MMIELIRRYQKDGDIRIIDKVLENLEKPSLESLKYEGQAPTVEDGTLFIAYRIKAFMMKATLRKVKAQNIHENGDQRENYFDLRKYIDKLEELLIGKDILFKQQEEGIWNPKNIAFLRQHEDDIKAFFPHDYPKIFSLLDSFEKQDRKMIREAYLQIKAFLLPIFVQGLQYALLKVDTERSKKEIVKFTNILMFNKFKEIQLRVTGKVRVYDKVNQKERIISPVFAEVDPWKLMFVGKTLAHCGLENVDPLITKKQREFLKDLYELITEELNSENRYAFHWNIDGSPRLNKRYLAEKLNMTEANFKMTLSRVNKRVHKHWSEIVDRWLSK